MSIHCDVCGRQILEHEIRRRYLFRKKIFCSAKCNNQRMNSLKARKETGRLKIWQHQQDLSGDVSHGYTRRGWLHFDPFFDINWEAHLLRNGWGLTFTCENNDCDKNLGLHLEVPGICLYLSLEFAWRLRKYVPNLGQTGVYTFNGSLIFNLFHNWKEGGGYYKSFNPKDWLLGRIKRISIVEIETGTVVLKMDGTTYEGRYVVTAEKWGRKRWIKYRRRVVTLHFDNPPQFAGKGESCWDCGDDGIYSIGYEGVSVRQAIDKYEEQVNHYRKKYGMPSQLVGCQ